MSEDDYYSGVDVGIDIYMDRAHKAEARVAQLVELLRRSSDWFKANYSYVYEDKETMQLWAEIDDELAKELADV